MDIWQIGVIVSLVCIGFYTLFLIMRTMIDIGDYMEKHKAPDPDINKSLTWRALEAVIAFSILVVISFCPIFNMWLCIVLIYIENNKDNIFEKFKDAYLTSKDYLE